MNPKSGRYRFHFFLRCRADRVYRFCFPGSIRCLDKLGGRPDKMLCLHLDRTCACVTKCIHFWMSQPYENTFIKMYENKPISPCNKMTKPLILAFKPNSRAICILLRMILHFATSHRSNSHCFRIRSAALARKSAGASISSTGPKLRSRMRSSVSSCRSYQSLTVMVSESVSRSVRFS